MAPRKPTYWAILPAAGVGRRMGAAIPKQYLDLGGVQVVEHSLRLFLEHPRIHRVIVALDPSDPHWARVPSARHPALIRVAGGPERCHSVWNALAALAHRAHARDWVLVHDAVRPCLRRSDLDRLIESLDDHPLGGLLGSPVYDTLKRGDAHRRVLCSVSREDLWHAYTPQMVRFGILYPRLEQALEAGALVTDEASALERAGDQPCLVEGHRDNLKITRPEDLALAHLILRSQGRCS